MLRLKMPAGECTPELYTLLDDLSREYGHGHLRLTTRQTFQLHGVSKHNLKTVIKVNRWLHWIRLGGFGGYSFGIFDLFIRRVTRDYAGRGTTHFGQTTLRACASVGSYAVLRPMAARFG